jgi:dTDP-glucose 4,6-dehydratase
MQNILVTGCAGFIGSHFTELCLDNGCSITGVDCLTYAGKISNMSTFIDNIDFYEEDICSTSRIIEILQTHKIDIIVNFAAETHVDNSINSPKEFIRSNIVGIDSLLLACRETSTKIVQISTDEVYGSKSEGLSSESSILSPRNPYSATKAAAEHLLTAYSATYGIAYKIIRMSNNFGPRQDSEKFLPTIISCIKKGKKIPVYGDGSNIRDWLYVKDSAKLIYAVIEKGKDNNTYNVTYDNKMTNTDLIKKVTNIMGVDYCSSIEFVKDRLGHDFRYSISNKKLKSLGIEDCTQFDIALIETVNEWNK